MSKRARRLKPSETARQDQYEARARDIGGEYGTVVFTTLYAPPDLPCEWCDCPMDDPRHQQEGYICNLPCSETSYYMLRLFHGKPNESHVLLCTRHYSDAVEALQEAMNRQLGPVPTAVVGINILDRGNQS